MWPQAGLFYSSRKEGLETWVDGAPSRSVNVDRSGWILRASWFGTRLSLIKNVVILWAQSSLLLHWQFQIRINTWPMIILKRAASCRTHGTVGAQIIMWVLRTISSLGIISLESSFLCLLLPFPVRHQCWWNMSYGEITEKEISTQDEGEGCKNIHHMLHQTC